MSVRRVGAGVGGSPLASMICASTSSGYRSAAFTSRRIAPGLTRACVTTLSDTVLRLPAALPKRIRQFPPGRAGDEPAPTDETVDEHHSSSDSMTRRSRGVGAQSSRTWDAERLDEA